MTELTAIRVHIYVVHPRAESLRLEEVSQDGTLALHIGPDDRAYIMLGGHSSDREADAKAMDRLAELATEAAARLRTIGAA